MGAKSVTEYVCDGCETKQYQIDLPEGWDWLSFGQEGKSRMLICNREEATFCGKLKALYYLKIQFPK